MFNSKLHHLFHILWLVLFAGTLIVGRSHPEIFLVAVAGWVFTQVFIRGIESSVAIFKPSSNDKD